jgi:DnaK suppressor protein
MAWMKTMTAVKTNFPKLPDGYKPSESEKYMNSMQVEYFRQKLLTWKADIIAETKGTISNLQSESEAHPDSIDRASAVADRQLELRARDRQRKLVGKIDSALRRIETGVYGFCKETGDEIGLSRLEARPIAVMTIEAQEMHEKGERTRAG